MPELHDPAGDTYNLLREFHRDHNVDCLPAAEQIALIQIHATLAVADRIDTLDSAVRDLHETLNSRSGRGAY
jgi:hypothetical protein